MEINWKEYFDNLARNEVEEYKKVGYGSERSLYAKFHVALSLLPFGGKERVLDIGCGTGIFANMLANRYPFLEIHALEISEEQLRLARKRNPSLNFNIGSITDIPYPDSFFDCVTCFGVLQNFNGSIVSAIAEMGRVLKEGGNLFITTMDTDYIGFKLGERKPNPINTYYVPKELKELLESEGISVIRMEAISSKKLEGLIVPLHHWHTFFIWGTK